MPVTTVGIAGITGKFGLCILSHLLSSSTVTIRGYCRNPSKLPPKVSSSPRIQIIEGDARNEVAVRNFVQACSVVICCYVGDNKLMVDGQRQLIDACEAEGVPRYISSDYTLDYRKLEYGQFPPKDPMKYVQRYLEKTRGVEAVHVLIGVFMENFFSEQFGVFDPVTRSLSYWGTGDELWEVTTHRDAAAFVARLALDETATGFRIFVGDRKSTKEIANTFDEVYGGPNMVLKRLGTLYDLFREMRHTREENPWNVYGNISAFYQFYAISGETHIYDEEEASKGPDIPHTTFKDFFKQHSIDSLSTARQNVAVNLEFKC